MVDGLPALLRTYNQRYFEGKRELSSSRIRSTISLLGNVKGKRILDLGCGTAEGSLFLRESGATVVCADIARYAIWRCNEENLAGIVCIGHTLPFRDNSFDGILLMDVIEHIPRSIVMPTLLEIKRVLRVGGKLAIHTMPNPFLEKLSVLYGLANKRHWRRWGVKGGHVNTYFSWRLKHELVSAGLGILCIKIGLYPKNAPFSTVLAPCSALFKGLLGNDLWACCSKF